eukprot:g4983.t1
MSSENVALEGEKIVAAGKAAATKADVNSKPLEGLPGKENENENRKKSEGMQESTKVAVRADDIDAKVMTEGDEKKPRGKLDLLVGRIPFMRFVVPEEGVMRTMAKAVIPGVTVGFLTIPQSMAYGVLAGVPPLHGLYASTLPLLMYFLLGTSAQLS